MGHESAEQHTPLNRLDTANSLNAVRQQLRIRLGGQDVGKQLILYSIIVIPLGKQDSFLDSE
jgi:hypothetical protein